MYCFYILYVGDFFTKMSFYTKKTVLNTPIVYI